MTTPALASRLAAAFAVAMLLANCARAAEEAFVIPAPAADDTKPAGATAVATFAGGCFWGIQGVYQHVNGVLKAVSGYAGGAKATAYYESVGSGTTGHAETVQITYDPSKVTYGKLLQVFFSVAHNPTQLNYQGPDHGTQYRSTIFAGNAEQRATAEKYIAQLNKTGVFKAPIVTTIEDGKTFYPAEAYHQDFLVKNPGYPYIVFNDMPKVRNLEKMFADVWRPEPVLVTPQRLTSR